MINREKKCMLGSVVIHAALLAALGVGSAFVSSSVPQNPDDVAPLPTIQQIPSNLVDELIYNPGGAQEIGPIQTPSEAPKPKPAPAPVAKPTPKPTPEKKAVTPPKVETKKTTQADTPVKKTEPKKINLDNLKTKLDPSKIASESQSKAQAEAEAAAEAAANAEAERQRKAWADVLSNVKGTIEDSGGSASTSDGKGTASQAKITGASLGTGDGTGSGEAVANYAQAVRSYYRNAWISPSSLKDDKLTTVVRVVINRNGSINSASITTRSGDKDLDASVQKAIDSVVKLPPFPRGSTDSTRTYTIRFNLKGANIL